MSTVDERLERLFVDAAVEPAGDGDVFGAVVRKRHHRHTRRIARNIGAVVVLLVALAASLAWLTADDGTEPAVAPTHRDSRTADDVWVGAQPVVLTPDRGYVRGPLVRSGEYVELATYERSGTGFNVPSHVVRVDASGKVLDDVELQGEILSLADGEGARWVVTHDGDNVASRLYRVKRIASDGSVQSNVFPVGVEPKGPIVVGGGAVWVPVSEAVVRFDAATGAYSGQVPLPGWLLPQVVRAGSDTYVYSSPLTTKGGSGLLELLRLTPATTSTADVVRIDEPVSSIVETRRGLWALASDGSRSVVAPLDPATGAFDRLRGVELPERFRATELQSGETTLWARGARSDGQPGLVRIKVRRDGRAVAGKPVTFRPPSNGAVLGLDGNEVLVAADGALYRVDIRS